MLAFPMLPFPVNQRWYEYYWMTERPPRLGYLAAVLRRLGRRTVSGPMRHCGAEARVPA